MMTSLLLAYLCLEPPAALAQAGALYRTGDCAGAAALYGPVVDAHPQRLGLRLNLARCLAGAGRMGDAIAEAETVVRADPTDAGGVRLWWQLRLAADAQPATGEWLVLLGRLTASSWSAGIVTAWGLAMMLGAYLLPTHRRAWLLGAVALPCLILTIGVTSIAAAAAQPDRVVTVTTATLRAGNGWSYPPAPWLGRRVSVADGTVAVVHKEAANGWRQVFLPDGRVGWLPPGSTRKLPW